MAKQTFSVGQVLTAAQMTSLQQTAMLGGSATAKTTSYTLVAADAGTVVSVNSTSATTITVNTGLFAAGDTVTIQNWGSGAVTITAGTATVNTAGSLIVPQYDGGVLYFTSASAAIYFDWVQAGATSPLTTKGDIWGYSTSDARIPVGANGTILTADSAETLGVKWATPSSGGDTWSLVNAGGTSLTGATTVTVSGISDAEKLMILISGASSVSANANFRVLVNTDSGTNYIYFGGRHKAGNTYNVNDIVEQNGSTTKTGIEIGDMSNNTGSIVSGYVFFGGGCKATTPKVFTSGGSGNANGSSDQKAFYSGGLYVGTSAITSVSAFSTSGNFDAGTIFVYKA